MIRDIRVALRKIQAKTEQGEIVWDVWNRINPDGDLSEAPEGRVFIASAFGRDVLLFTAGSRYEDPETGVPVFGRFPIFQLSSGAVLAQGEDVWPLYRAAEAQFDRVDDFWDAVLADDRKKR